MQTVNSKPENALAAGQSYADIMRQTGIQKPYLSLLMNHFERMKRGDRVLRQQALCGIAARLDGASVKHAPSEGNAQQPSTPV